MDIWTDELARVGITADILQKCYVRAKDIRRERNLIQPNHFPIAATEIITAYDILMSEKRGRDRVRAIKNGDCPVCAEIALDPSGLGRQCPYHPETESAQASGGVRIES